MKEKYVHPSSDHELITQHRVSDISNLLQPGRGLGVRWGPGGVRVGAWRGPGGGAVGAGWGRGGGRMGARWGPGGGELFNGV